MEGATESGKVTYVRARNTNSCFEGRGAIFATNKDVY
jgi:hypothetical protein